MPLGGYRGAGGTGAQPYRTLYTRTAT